MPNDGRRRAKTAVKVFVREATLTRAELDAVRLPRDAVVLERVTGADEFVAEEGPVRRYRRHVEVLEQIGDSGARVRQTVEVSAAIPFWGWIFSRPLVRHLARIRPVARTPWWLPPDRLDARASVVLARLGVLAYVLGYCGTLLTQTITYAAAEFGQGRAAQGVSLAAVRADVLLAVPLALLADRRGRRLLVVFGTIAACSFATLGVLSVSLGTLTVAQVLARGSGSAAVVTLGVMVAEEMPAGARAWATSLMVMAGAFGAGLCVILLPVADMNPVAVPMTDWHVGAWRLLYLVPFAGIPLARAAGRGLEESRRFVVAHASRVRGHGRRFWLLALSGFLLALFTSPASQFQNEFLRNDRGFSGARITLFILATSIPGSIGIVVGGRLAEIGRRAVGALAVAVGVGLTVVMYHSTGWPLWAVSSIGSIFGAAAVPALGVYGAELFPTGARGAANGMLGLIARVGSVIGLVATGYLADRIGLARALLYMAAGPAVMTALVLLFYPETAHRELEDLNPEDAAPSS
ncbi:MAG TPA: MFS transporter [Acidimicrobiales bacterium]|nr:MFS transporter [Acidimicrobiales bacterium]